MELIQGSRKFHGVIQELNHISLGGSGRKNTYNPIFNQESFLIIMKCSSNVAV